MSFIHRLMTGRSIRLAAHAAYDVGIYRKIRRITMLRRLALANVSGALFADAVGSKQTDVSSYEREGSYVVLSLYTPKLLHSSLRDSLDLIARILPPRESWPLSPMAGCKSVICKQDHRSTCVNCTGAIIYLTPSVSIAVPSPVTLGMVSTLIPPGLNSKGGAHWWTIIWSMYLHFR